MPSLTSIGVINSSDKKINEYALLDFKRSEDDTLRFQKVVFYEMLPDGKFENGTTVEEMLRVSIERIQELNSRFPCRENSIVITKMQEALMWLNARTKEREGRGVEGTLAK